jgi:hypothetical protein
MTSRKQELKRLYKGTFKPRFDDGGSVYSSYAGTGPSYYNSYTAPPPDVSMPPLLPDPGTQPPVDTGQTHVPYGTQNPDGSYNVDAGPTGNYPGMPDTNAGSQTQIDPATGQPIGPGPGPGPVPESIPTDSQGNPIDPSAPPTDTSGGGAPAGSFTMPSSVADLLSKLGIDPKNISNAGALLTSLMPLLQGNRNAQTPNLPAAPPGFGGAGSTMNIQSTPQRQMNPALAAMQPADWFTYGQKPANQQPTGGQFFSPTGQDQSQIAQPSPLQQATNPQYTPPQTNVNVGQVSPNEMLAGLLKPPAHAEGGRISMAMGGAMPNTPIGAGSYNGSGSIPVMGATPVAQPAPAPLSPLQHFGPQPGSMSQQMHTGGIQQPWSTQPPAQPQSSFGWQQHLGGGPLPANTQAPPQAQPQPLNTGQPIAGTYGTGKMTPAMQAMYGMTPGPTQAQMDAGRAAMPPPTPPIMPNSPGYSGNHFNVPGWQPGQPAPHNMNATQGMPVGWQHPGALTHPAFMQHRGFGGFPRGRAEGGSVHYASGGSSNASYAPMAIPLNPGPAPHSIISGHFQGLTGFESPQGAVGSPVGPSGPIQTQVPPALAGLLGAIAQRQHRSQYSDRALADGGQPGQPINPDDGFDGPLRAVGHVRGEGHGRADLIDAKLSDGEWVAPAHLVAALGNGSNDAGADVLDKLGDDVRKHIGKAMVKGKQPKTIKLKIAEEKG